MAEWLPDLTQCATVFEGEPIISEVPRPRAAPYIHLEIANICELFGLRTSANYCEILNCETSANSCELLRIFANFCEFSFANFCELLRTFAKFCEFSYFEPLQPFLGLRTFANFREIRKILTKNEFLMTFPIVKVEQNRKTVKYRLIDSNIESPGATRVQERR